MYKEGKNEVGVQPYAPQLSPQPHPCRLYLGGSEYMRAGYHRKLYINYLCQHWRNAPRLELPSLVLCKLRPST
jgi:hypothetical protein